MSNNDDEPDTKVITHSIPKPCALPCARIDALQNNNFINFKAYFIVLSHSDIQNKLYIYSIIHFYHFNLATKPNKTYKTLNIPLKNEKQTSYNCFKIQ